MAADDVGSILGHLKLDRSDWDEELRLAGVKADELARHNPNIKIGTNAPSAIAQLNAVAVAVKRLQDAQGAEAVAEAKLAEIRSKGTGSAAQLATAEERVEKSRRSVAAATIALAAAQEQNTTSTNKSTESAKAAEKQFNLLLTAITAIGPAIVPVAGAALGAAAGLSGMGLAGIIAIKGIQAEMKSGSKAGTEYTAQIGQMKSAFGSLSQTVATGFLPGFEEAIHKFSENAPQLQVALAGSAHALGAISEHLVGGLIQGFTTFNPLIAASQAEVEKLAQRFEAWEAGPGGARFAQTMTSDFHQVVPVLGSLVVTAGHLVAAFHPIGLTVVSELGALSKVINAIPVPLLQAAADAFVAYRVAVAVTAPFDMAAKALKGLAVAETEAAVAGGGSSAGGIGGVAGKLTTTLGLLKPAAAAWVGLAVATNQAAKATSDYAYSSNVLARGLAAGTQIDKDIFTLHFSHLGQDMHPNAARNALVDQQNKYSAALDDIAQGQALAAHPTPDSVPGNNVLAPQFQGPSRITTDYAHDATIIGDAQAYAAAKAKSWSQSVDQAARSMGYLHQQISAGAVPISQAGQAYNDVQQQIQRSVDASDAFVKLGGKTVETYRGVAIGQNTLDAALQQTNGDYHAAIGLIQGQIDSMQNNRSVINDLIIHQQRLSQFQGDVATKYGLSTQQVDLFASAMGLSADKITDSNASMKTSEATFGQFAKSIQNGSTALQGWIGAVDQFNKAGDTAASRGQLIGQALVAANGDMLAYANTMISASSASAQLVTDFKAAGTGILNLKTGALNFVPAAQQVVGDLSSMQTAAENAAAATYQHETALGKASAANDAFSVYVADTSGALTSQYRQMGLTKDQANKLANQYFDIKNVGDLKKQIALIGQDKVLSALGGILRDLDAMTGRHEADLLLTGQIDPTAQQILHVVQPGHTAAYTIRGGAGVITSAVASGGTIDPTVPGGVIRHAQSGLTVSGPGGPKADAAGLYALSDGEEVVPEPFASMNRPLLKAISRGFKMPALHSVTSGRHAMTADQVAAIAQAAAAAVMANMPPTVLKVGPRELARANNDGQRRIGSLQP